MTTDNREPMTPTVIVPLTHLLHVAADIRMYLQRADSAADFEARMRSKASANEDRSERLILERQAQDANRAIGTERMRAASLLAQLITDTTKIKVKIDQEG